MKIYAFKDPFNRTSSSGGAFPALVKAVEKLNECTPVVYGAAFDQDFNVIHIRATSETDLVKLRGSKYVRSDLKDSFSKIIEDLNNDKTVIFSGTPCQVAAIKKKIETMKIKTDKFFLIDIVCHGTPRPVVWKDFKKWIENREKSSLTEFSFRYKDSRWKSYPTMAKFDNGKIKVNSFNLRRYTELFYSDLVLNEGCYKCKYANLNRISDVTIGDFWGIRKVLPKFPYKEEVSQILVNTKRGDSLLQQMLHENKYIICIADLMLAYKYQESFIHPPFRKDKVDEFWNDYENMSFEKILSKYAGYNFEGFIKHWVKKLLGNTGGIYIIKNILKR